MKNRKDEGFTLIELLIVIVILGILSTIVVFAVRGVTQDSQQNACQATQKTYQVALEAFYAGGETPAAGAHPDGDDLVDAELIREYNPTSNGVQVVDGDSRTPVAVSLVGPVTGGDCDGEITAS